MALDARQILIVDVVDDVKRVRLQRHTFTVGNGKTSKTIFHAVTIVLVDTLVASSSGLFQKTPSAMPFRCFSRWFRFRPPPKRPKRYVGRVPLGRFRVVVVEIIHVLRFVKQLFPRRRELPFQRQTKPPGQHATPHGLHFGQQGVHFSSVRAPVSFQHKAPKIELHDGGSSVETKHPLHGVPHDLRHGRPQRKRFSLAQHRSRWQMKLFARRTLGRRGHP